MSLIKPQQNINLLLGDYDGIKEVQRVQCPAESAAAQGDYFVITAPDGVRFAGWLNIDEDDTAPTGASYVSAENKIEVNIQEDDTNLEVAQKVSAAFGAVSAFSDRFEFINDDESFIWRPFLKVNTPAVIVANANASGAGSFVGQTIEEGQEPIISVEGSQQSEQPLGKLI